MSSSSFSNSSTCSSSTSSGEGPESPVTKKRRTSAVTGGGKFRWTWELPPYIAESTKGEKFAFCKLCNSHFSVSHGGFHDITRHTNGLAHGQRLKDAQGTTSIASAFSQSHADTSAKVISAEIMMSQFIAMHNLSFQTADHFSDLVSAMFPDSKIAAGFSCKHTKTKAIICDAIEPHLKKPVIDVARASPFNLLCDESNERGDAVKLLTVLVRVFESNNANVVTRHLDTIGITDLSAEGIFSGLEKTLEKYRLPFSKLISFTSDTCNVMKGARGGVIAKLREKQPKIIDIHCICHVVNLCVKAAVKVLPLKVDDLLVDIYYHFHHSVKRVASLGEYADFCATEYKSVLKHCETRWLSLGRAIQRTLHMWEPLCSYFCSHPDVEKAGKVRSIYRLLNDPLTKPWLLFLSNVLPVFERFNVFFQTSSAATVHKILGESERLLKTVLSFYIDPKVVRLNSSDITKVNYTDSSNYLPSDKVFVGDNTTALLTHLRDNEGEQVHVVYEKVVNFYEQFIKKQLKVFPFESQVLHALEFLDPIKSLSIPSSVFDTIEENIAIEFDKALTKLEHREFVCDTEICPEDDCDALTFWLKVHSLKSAMGSLKYENLSILALQLLAIPTSNADSERVFSLVRRIKTDFRASLSPETVSALIGCHFNKSGKCCEVTKFDDSLLIQAKQCTRQRNLSYFK